MLGLKLIVRQIRHPVFALLCAVLFGCVAVVVGGNAVDEAQRFAAADDPVAISDRALDRVFTQGVAEREIRAALTATAQPLGPPRPDSDFGAGLVSAYRAVMWLDRSPATPTDGGPQAKQ